MGHRRRRRPVDPGVRDRHLGQRGQSHRFQDRHPGLELHDRHLPHGLVPRTRRPSHRLRHAVGNAASATAGVHHRCDHGALRLRYVGGVGVVERPHHGRLGRVHRFAQANRHRWPEPHHLHRPQRRQSLGCGLPDLRHELAGVQHLRRCELLPGCGQRSRLQAQLQPAVRHTQLGAGAGLLLQLRVRDRALHGAQRLRRLLRVRYRLRSLWRRTAQPQGVHVGRARRVLVGSAARERRGSARRRREPAVPERERGLLARAVGTLGGFIPHGLPDPRVVQGDLGQCRQQGRRQDRPVAGVDRHMARSAIRRQFDRGPPSGECAHRHHVHGQQLRPPGHRLGRRRQDTAVAQHAACIHGIRNDDRSGAAHGRLRVQ